MGAERLEIDLPMWNLIKFQVTDVWIQVGAIDLFHPSTKRAKALYSSDALYSESRSLAIIHESFDPASKVPRKKSLPYPSVRVTYLLFWTIRVPLGR